MSSIGKKRERDNSLPKKAIQCFFRGKKREVYITGSIIENGKTFYLSEIFRIELIENDSVIKYVATLRNDIKICIKKTSKINFVPSDDTSHPPNIIGEGAYGFALKIMSIDDGKWYVVKVLRNEEDVKNEWYGLNLIYGKHKCLQLGIHHQTCRNGDVENIIVSEFQGDIVLSRFRNSYKFTIKDIINLFFDLLKGINELHKLRILHCDIKPDNIIINEDEDGLITLVLIDFGILRTLFEQSKKPNSHYTWCYRNPRLFLNDFLKSFDTSLMPFIEPVKLEPTLDCWAFFITMLHTFSCPSNNFLGLLSEEKARRDMIRDSCVTNLMIQMKPWLGKEERNVDFVWVVYIVLLNKEGPVKMSEAFKMYGLDFDCDEIYEEYVKMFHKLRDEHPIIGHIKNIFKNMRCKDETLDISEIIRQLNELFVEILRDGADLSLLGCLRNEDVQNWVNRLNEIIKGINKDIFLF
jgi:serine/threonine protein kinase